MLDRHQNTTPKQNIHTHTFQATNTNDEFQNDPILHEETSSIIQTVPLNTYSLCFVFQKMSATGYGGDGCTDDDFRGERPPDLIGSVFQSRLHVHTVPLAPRPASGADRWRQTTFVSMRRYWTAPWRSICLRASVTQGASPASPAGGNVAWPCSQEGRGPSPRQPALGTPEESAPVGLYEIAPPVSVGATDR